MLVGLLPGGAQAVEARAATTNDAEALRAAFEDLTAPTGPLKYGNKLVDLTGIRTFESQETGEKIHTPLDFLTGRYYLAAEIQGKYYIFNGANLPTNGRANAYERTLYGSSLGNVNKQQTILFIFNGTNTGSDSSYAIRLARGDYLARVQDGNALFATTTSKVSHTAWIWSTDEKRIVLNDYYSGIGLDGTSTLNQRYCIALSSDKKSFGWLPVTHYDAHGSGTDYTRFYLFRYCYRLDELYNALNTMKSYLDRPDGVSEELYQCFLDSYRTALELYEQYNVTLTEQLFLDSEYIQTQIDHYRNEVLSYLKLMDLSLSYLDIPVQVLDFRADGFLFENPGTFTAPYNLSMNSPDVVLPDGSTLSRPGELLWGENHVEGDTLNFFVKGLIEPELVNGSIVYTPAVIEYIANALMYHTDHIPNPVHYRKNWNDIFLSKKKEAGFALGSWEDTLAKINYTNGNPMTWTQVETAFDLAYYMLLYVWQPTVDGDVLEENVAVNSGTMDLPYNMEVPELNYLRLYYDSSTKLYSFVSNNSYSRSAGYIFNDGQTKLSGGPGFNIAHNLGFEHPDVFPVKTTGTNSDDSVTSYRKDANFFYSLHAKSKFVYYKDKNYFFDFTGDDDVYFFINDTLICDIGGIHGSPRRFVYLEDKIENSDQTYAEYLGLKDGDICSFDMFFADRHLTGINLTFKTNIQLLNEDVITEKHQYQVQSAGQAVTGSNGMGKYLPDSSIVNIGDTVAYSFDLLNKGEVPVRQVGFRDEVLGTELSDTVTVLSDPVKTNGASTAYGDLKLFYGPYSPNAGTDFKSTATAIDFASLKALLEELNQSSLVEGNLEYPTFPQTLYCFTPTGTVTVKDDSTGANISLSAEDQLQILLELGVPAYGHLKFYGIRRRTCSEDMPFRNVLRSVCYDRLNGNLKIEGIARRSLRVPDLSNNLLPEVDAAITVIDYGKAVELPFPHLKERIYTTHTQLVGEFVGLTTSGSNGDLLPICPTELYCTAAGKTLTWGNGIFSRETNGIRFTPTKMLSQVNRVFAVYALSGCYGPGANGTSVEYKYILQELRMVPATTMYYETDFASNIFTLVQKGSADGWKAQGDTTSAADPLQDYEPLAGTVYNKKIDGKDVPANAFFVDFDGRGYGRRYRDTPLYKGTDFDKYYISNTSDQLANNWVINSINSSPASIDHSTGTLSFTMKTSGTSVYVQTGTSLSATASPLQLIPEEENVAQVRFQLQNFVLGADGDEPIFRLYYTDPDSASSDKLQYDEISFPEEYLSNGQYYTVTLPLSGKYAAEPVIDRLRVQLYNLKNKSTSSTGSMTIDYIYVGPTEGLPQGIRKEYLFFDFTNTAADQLRYESSVYSGINFDAVNTDGTATNWSGRDEGFTKGTAKITDGTLEVRPHDASFASIYCDTQSGSNIATTHLIHYDASNAEVFQYRFKVTGPTDNNATATAKVHFYYESGSVQNPYDKHLESDPAYFDSAYLSNGKYVTVQGTIPQAVRDKKDFDRLIMWIGGFPKQTDGRAAVLTFDYIYIGPKEELDRINAAQSTQDKMNLELPGEDHLFFDFANGDADKLRYSNKVYGGKNFDLQGNIIYPANQATLQSVGDGTLVLKDKTNTTSDEGALGNIYFNLRDFNYSPSKDDWFEIRLRIDGGQKDSFRSTGIRIDCFGTEAPTSGKQTITEPFDWDARANKGYFTVRIPSNVANHASFGNLYRIHPVIMGTQGATITVDYVYLGPLQEATPADPSLYFGFGDTAEDRCRYESDTYGFTNYDSRNWIPEVSNTANTVDACPANWTAANGTVGYDTKKGNLVFSIPSGSSTHSLQTGTSEKLLLNYHPAVENVAQIRFKTENITLGSGFAVTLEYQAVGSSVYGSAESFTLAPLYELNPNEDYGVFNLQLSDAFCKAAAIGSIQLTFKDATASDSSGGRFLIDYIYVGAGRMAPEPVYGYDSSYENDTELSNGSSYVVQGQGIKTAPDTASYTEASFDFRGTGFDIISRTGPAQATIRVEVRKKGATDPVKTMTVNNKGELELFQIPVVSVQGLEYGEYTVTLWVNKAFNSSISFLQRGGTFHFDAVRIYDPMGKDASVNPDALISYVTDQEAYPHIKEVRNILLSASEYATMADVGTGAIFVDASTVPSESIPTTDADGNPATTVVKPDGIELVGPHIAKVQTYNKIGPKNEVYLSPGQAVAFKLQISTTFIPTSVDVGVKTIRSNEPAKLLAAVVSQKPDSDGLLEIDAARQIRLNSASSRYYALPIDTNSFVKEGNHRYCYIVLHNMGGSGLSNVLSVTDLKLAYSSKPEVGLPQDAPTDPEIPNLPEVVGTSLIKRSTDSYFDFVIDDRTLEAAALVMRAVLETPTMTEDTEIMHSLNLSSDIAMNYVVSKSTLVDYDSFYLECVLPGQDSARKIEPIERGNYYYFTLEGLTAVQMADVVSATLYMEKDGRSYYTETDHYSICQYAYAQLGKEGASPELKTLCAELLRYGATAQIYKAYRTDSLADSLLTEEQRAYCTDLDTVSFGNHNRLTGEEDTYPVAWIGKSLILDSRVTLRFVVDPGEYRNSTSRLSMRISYTDIHGEEQTAVVTSCQPYGAGYYSFDFSGLTAAELRTVLSATVYAGDQAVSQSLQYSADTYGTGKTGNLGKLCKALVAYSDSARAFFTAT